MAKELEYETKDPAVLWYWNDWAGGTKTFTRFLKGCYMDLLDAQFNSGSLSLEEIKTVLGSDFGSSWPTLQKKFKQDSNGLYYNARLTFEKVRRSNYSKSRKKNLKGKNLDGHMENENGNEIVIEFELRERYGEGMCKEFERYWNEKNAKGKMRWEFEKTFEVPKRLVTWASRSKSFNKEPKTGNKVENFLSEYEKAKSI